jgi:hypothetical protein
VAFAPRPRAQRIEQAGCRGTPRRRPAAPPSV